MSVQIARKSKMNISVPTASMPDIIFQLLIFFMVTTVLRTHSGLQVTLPDAASVEKLESKRNVATVWIDSENRVVIDDVSVGEDISVLKTAAYQKLVETNGKLIMSLKVDRGAEMGRLIDVQQELRKAEALRVNYSALPVAAG